MSSFWQHKRILHSSILSTLSTSNKYSQRSLSILSRSSISTPKVSSNIRKSSSYTSQVSRNQHSFSTFTAIRDAAARAVVSQAIDRMGNEKPTPAIANTKSVDEDVEYDALTWKSIVVSKDFF